MEKSIIELMNEFLQLAIPDSFFANCEKVCILFEEDILNFKNKFKDTNIMNENTDIKFLLNKKLYVGDKSKEIQEKLFKLGFSWGQDLEFKTKQVRHINAPFLYIGEDKLLCYGNDDILYINHSYIEIFIEDILSIPDPITKIKPFEKVLVRNSDSQIWQCDIFSHLSINDLFICIGGNWKQCLPYENNETLLNNKKAIIEEDYILIAGLKFAKENLGTDTENPNGKFYSFKEAKENCPKGWRLPSKDEWGLFINNTTSIWDDTKKGKIFTCKNTGNTILLPAEGSVRLNRNYSYYWASTLYNTAFSYNLYFNSIHISSKDISNILYGAKVRLIKD